MPTNNLATLTFSLSEAPQSIKTVGDSRDFVPLQFIQEIWETDLTQTKEVGRTVQDELSFLLLLMGVDTYQFFGLSFIQSRTLVKFKIETVYNECVTPEQLKSKKSYDVYQVFGLSSNQEIILDLEIVRKLRFLVQKRLKRRLGNLYKHFFTNDGGVNPVEELNKYSKVRFTSIYEDVLLLLYSGQYELNKSLEKINI